MKKISSERSSHDNANNPQAEYHLNGDYRYGVYDTASVGNGEKGGKPGRDFVCGAYSIDGNHPFYTNTK